MATILILDDRPLDRKLLRVMLAAAGHEVIEASDGRDALALAAVSRPDLVISDILMLPMDGYEFVRRLRASPALASTRVLFYTATYHEREARALAVECGVIDILMKPSPRQTVLAAVDRALAADPTVPAAGLAADFEQRHLSVVNSALKARIARHDADIRRASERAREDERAGVSRALHDRLAQSLAAMRMDLSLIATEAGRRTRAPWPEVAARAASGLTRVDEMIGAVRDITIALRSPLPDEGRLFGTIDRLAEEFERRSAIRCRVRRSGQEPALDRETISAVFMIVQEALTNVHRHAHATRATIDLRVSARRLAIGIEDNGRGVGRTDRTGTGSFGLVGMRERAMLLGGSLDVRNRRPRGTVVALSVPL